MVIVGPYEFLADDQVLYGIHSRDKTAIPPAEKARTALAAYNMLNVDVGWMSKKSAKWLRDNAGEIPRGFSEVGSEPVIKILESQIGKIGVVFFPEGPVAGKSPAPGQEEAVLSAARNLKNRVVMVLGISPWGYVGERDFLVKADGLFNCILGSGEGVGFSGTVPQKAPGVLWIRPDGQGRAINILELYSRPQLGQSLPWQERKTFGANLEFLDDSCPSDPGMLRLVGPPPPRS